MFGGMRAARLSTFTYFALNGFLMGMWVVHIPTIEHRTGINHPTLGMLLLLLGGGAFLGMQAIGPLADRFGARVTVPVTAALNSVCVILPGVATNGWMLGVFVTGVLVIGLIAYPVFRNVRLTVFHAVL
ncbi:MFS transporter, partial [Kibdelosporangium lantanae]